jgi:integrase
MPVNIDDMNTLTQSETTRQNHESGQVVAKQNVLGHFSKASKPVRRHLPPTHKDYWKPRLEHRCYTRDGKSVELAEYSVRFQHLGKRASFGLGASDTEAAAATARDIYIFLKANGWDATFAKFKPKPESKNGLTVGEYLKAVRETSKLRVRTYLNYENCLRSIIAGVFGIKDTAAKFDYRGGGNQKWRERMNSIRMEKLTPEAVERWMKKFVASAGTSPNAVASARRTANSYVRCARALFGVALLKEPSVRKLALPAVLPFKGVELFESGSAKYISKINAQTLIAAARNELKATEPEVYKGFLLGLFAGMRKGEIDLLEWDMVDWERHAIQLEETEWLRLKIADSAGEITVDAEVLEELRAFMPSSQSAFVITSDRPPRTDSPRPYYRCEPSFERLNEWLRSKGIAANKPLHELRKEIGALIATEHGIYAASRFLRHSDITTTARH